MAEPLVVIVGACTDTSARIFVAADVGKSPAAPVARIAWRVAGGPVNSPAPLALTSAPPYETGVFELAGLPASAEIEYAVDAADGAASLTPAATLLAGAGARTFRLLPNGRPLRVALVSCNGPDEQKLGAGEMYAMWRRLGAEIAAGRVDLIVHCGDQIYADGIKAQAEPQPDVAALTRRYRRKYVEVWSRPILRRVLGSCPSLMTWDDHDVYDGRGSQDDDDAPRQRGIFEAARQAYAEFQTSHGAQRLGASSAAWSFVHAGLGILGLDLRTNRRWSSGTVMGAGQIADVRAWLVSNAPRLKHLYVVSSIPPVHAQVAALLSLFELTPWTEELTDDLRDTWVARNNRREFADLVLPLFSALAANRGLRITVLGGDVHVATAGWIESRLSAHALGGRPARMHQVVSSGIGTLPPSTFETAAMKAIMPGEIELVRDHVVGVLSPIEGLGDRVLARRNFVVLSLEDSRGAWSAHGNVTAAYHAEGCDEPYMHQFYGS